jgi:hypothetical protein
LSMLASVPWVMLSAMYGVLMTCLASHLFSHGDLNGAIIGL